MNHYLLLLCGVFLLLTGCITEQTKPTPPDASPEKPIILHPPITRSKAIEIARAQADRVYGKKNIDRQMPLMAFLSEDGRSWKVVGTLQCAPNCFGGVVEVKIDAKSGMLLQMKHGR